MHVPRRRGIGHGGQTRTRFSRRARPGCGRYGGTPPARPRRGPRSGGAAAPPTRTRRARRPSRSARSLLSSRVRAWCRRWASSHFPGVVPVSAANRRAKVRSDIAARRASTRTGCSSARCSRIQVSRGARLSASQLGHGQVDVLTLSAVALRRHHHPAGDPVRHGCPELAPDVVQAGVDAGGRSGTRDHAVVLDEQDVRVDRRHGVAPLQVVGVPPVRGARATVEQPGLAEQEGAGADREDPGPAGVRPAEDVDHRLRGRLVVVEGRGHDEVGVVGVGEAVRGRDRDAVRHGDGLAGPLGAGAVVEVGYAVIGAVDPEDLVDDAELEQGRSVRAGRRRRW